MRAHNKGVMDEINITPLTDIFLVLLIIMMVVAPMLNYRALLVRFSSSDGAVSKTESVKTMSLIVNDNGDIQVEGEVVARERVPERVREMAAQFPDGVEVAVSPEASLDAMTFALNAVQSAGIEKVAVTPKSGAEEAKPATDAPPGTRPPRQR